MQSGPQETDNTSDQSGKKQKKNKSRLHGAKEWIKKHKPHHSKNKKRSEDTSEATTHSNESPAEEIIATSTPHVDAAEKKHLHKKKKHAHKKKKHHHKKKEKVDVTDTNEIFEPEHTESVSPVIQATASDTQPTTAIPLEENLSAIPLPNPKTPNFAAHGSDADDEATDSLKYSISSDNLTPVSTPEYKTPPPTPKTPPYLVSSDASLSDSEDSLSKTDDDQIFTHSDSGISTIPPVAPLPDAATSNDATETTYLDELRQRLNAESDDTSEASDDEDNQNESDQNAVAPNALRRLYNWSAEKAEQGSALLGKHVPGYAWTMNNVASPTVNAVKTGASWTGNKINQYAIQPTWRGIKSTSSWSAEKAAQGNALLKKYVPGYAWTINNVANPTVNAVKTGASWTGDKINQYAIQPTWHGVQSAGNWTSNQLKSGYHWVRGNKPTTAAEEANGISLEKTEAPATAAEENTSNRLFSKVTSWLPGFGHHTTSKPAAANDATVENSAEAAKKAANKL